MTCPLPACVAPSCIPGGRAWCATSTAPADVEAFTADVVAYMRLTGQRDAGKAAARVFRDAMTRRRECLLS